jgi:hypothetical protein
MRLLIEGLTPNLTDYVEEFIDFMCGTIGVEERPEVSFVSRTGNASFGHYQPSTGAIVVATEGRHIADTLRTLGHEIVHHKQMEAGEIDTLPLLDLERDANAVVGLAMRDYNKLHPELYGVEEPLPGNQLDQEGESQGSTFPDTTRPSGPIEMAEAKIRETDSDTLKLLKLQNQALRAFPSSPRQREIQKQIEALRKKMKTQGTPEYHTTLKEAMLSELSNKTLAGYKTKALQARKAGQKKFWYGTYETGEWKFPNSGKPYPEDKTRTKGIETAIQKLKSRYAHLREEGIVNAAGAGAVAGIGIGPQGEPGVSKKKKSPILQPMLKRFKALREEYKDTAIEARKKLATGKIPATAEELLARRKLVAQINAPKKKEA